MTGHDTKEKWASWTLPIFKLGHSGHCLAGPSWPTLPFQLAKCLGK